MKYLAFDCGCKFPKEDHAVKFDPDTIPLDCKNTWELISSGNTKGCFQLESRLGQSMAKKLKPENIEQLSALISIMRPGCLEAIRDGKTVSNHFIDKKNGQESVDYFHPALESSLKSSYGEMIYQEQAMQIARDIAGFDLKEADMLRKAIGKKKPEEMAKIKKIFIAGCSKSNIVNENEAEQIFGWIEKSQRYSFNKSHAVSYAVNGYLSAYAKAHFPKIFFASYLRYAKDKIDPQQEIKELVRNAVEMDIDIRIPKLSMLKKDFVIHNESIYFGITNIKGVGESVFNKIDEICGVYNKEKLFSSVYSVIFLLLNNINSAAAKAIISAGGLDEYKTYRKQLLFYMDTITNLTKKECEFIEKNCEFSKYKSLKDILLFLLNNHKVNKNRKAIIENYIKAIDHPPYSLKDNMEWVTEMESFYLGTTVSYSKTDCYDMSDFNIITCKDYKNSTPSKAIAVVGEVGRVNVVKTKTGKNKGAEMSFIEIFDGTGTIDSVILFPEQYAKYSDIVKEERVLVFVGTKLNKEREGFVVEKCFEPRS
jgi:DNA polymerase-3 subunit alpha